MPVSTTCRHAHTEFRRRAHTTRAAFIPGRVNIMEFHMRESRVLKAMRSGKVATCVKINLADQRNVEIAAMSA